MFAYPVLPAILPQHLRLGSITLLALIALLTGVLSLRRAGNRGLWLTASLLGTAFVLFARWHTYPAYPERPQDTFLREGIAWANFLSWFFLVAVSVTFIRRHPDSKKVVIGTWACVGPPLLLWMSACVYPRSAAYGSSCQYQLKQVGIAMYSYAETYDGRLHQLLFTSAAVTDRSWRVEILPFLQESALRNSYHDDAAWDASANIPASSERRNPYVCPANERQTDALGRVYSAYLAAAGDRSLFGANGMGRRWDDIPDGRANTVLIVEACGQNVVWTEPRDLDIATVPAGVNFAGNQLGRSEGSFSAYHPGGPGVLMADGSVRRLEPKTDPAILRAILTVDGNEKSQFE